MSKVRIWFDTPPTQGWNLAEIEEPTAMSPKPEASDVKCSVKGCGELAAFIVNRKAFCMRHKI